MNRSGWPVAPCGVQIEAGQVWRREGLKSPLVIIEAFSGYRVHVRPCGADGVATRRRGRWVYVSLLNGKKRGYSLEIAW